MPPILYPKPENVTPRSRFRSNRFILATTRSEMAAKSPITPGHQKKKTKVYCNSCRTSRGVSPGSCSTTITTTTSTNRGRRRRRRRWRWRGRVRHCNYVSQFGVGVRIGGVTRPEIKSTAVGPARLCPPPVAHRFINHESELRVASRIHMWRGWMRQEAENHRAKQGGCDTHQPGSRISSLTLSTTTLDRPKNSPPAPFKRKRTAWTLCNWLGRGLCFPVARSNDGGGSPVLRQAARMHVKSNWRLSLNDNARLSAAVRC